MFKKLKERMAENRKKNGDMGIIPKINNIEDAIKASKQGVQVSKFMATCMAIIMVMGIYYLYADGWDELLFMGVIAFAMLVPIFLLIGFWIKKMSRIASIIGLCLYIHVQICAIECIGGDGIFIAIFIVIYYINAIRGTFAYHKYKKQEDQSERQAI